MKKILTTLICFLVVIASFSQTPKIDSLKAELLVVKEKLRDDKFNLNLVQLQTGILKKLIVRGNFEVNSLAAEIKRLTEEYEANPPEEEEEEEEDTSSENVISITDFLAYEVDLPEYDILENRRPGLSFIPRLQLWIDYTRHGVIRSDATYATILTSKLEDWDIPEPHIRYITDRFSDIDLDSNLTEVEIGTENFITPTTPNTTFVRFTPSIHSCIDTTRRAVATIYFDVLSNKLSTVRFNCVSCKRLQAMVDREVYKERVYQVYDLPSDEKKKNSKRKRVQLRKARKLPK